MNSVKKCSAITSLVLGLGASLSALNADAADTTCVPKHHFSTLVPGTLTVAVVPVWPTVDVKDGKLVGFEGQLLNEFAKDECLKLDIQQISGAGIIPAVQAKRVDIATGGWVRSERRVGVVAFTYPTMLSQVALISKGDFKQFSDAKGRRIGTPQGNLWVQETQTYYGDNLKIYQSFDQLFADMRTGRVEVGIVPYELGKEVTADGTIPGAKLSVPKGIPQISTSMKPPQVAFPHVLGNQAFTSALDDDIKSMHSSGFIGKTLESVGLPADLGDTGTPYYVK